jgi:hypothetical protein
MRQLVHGLSPSVARQATRTARPDAARAGTRRLVVLLASLVLVTLVLASCGRGALADGVTDSTFVAAMADLERVERAPGLDDPARVAARTAALQRRGLTRASLEAAAAALADDPERAVALYRAIGAKANGDSAVRRDSASGSAVLRRR